MNHNKIHKVLESKFKDWDILHLEFESYNLFRDNPELLKHFIVAFDDYAMFEQDDHDAVPDKIYDIVERTENQFLSYQILNITQPVSKSKFRTWNGDDGHTGYIVDYSKEYGLSNCVYFVMGMLKCIDTFEVAQFVVVGKKEDKIKVMVIKINSEQIRFDELR